MKNQQNPTGAATQASIKQFDASRKSALKSDKTGLVVGPSLMKAIKNCVRPVSAN